MTIIRHILTMGTRWCPGCFADLGRGQMHKRGCPIRD